ncbi:MAG: hypothetical protein EB832_04535 [Thaumarchaeota archaeon S14]|nr:MAG: hypothetical protein EB832_04535 [Thaumarchaeota archaeon S14]
MATRRAVRLGAALRRVVVLLAAVLRRVVVLLAAVLRRVVVLLAAVLRRVVVLLVVVRLVATLRLAVRRRVVILLEATRRRVAVFLAGALRRVVFLAVVRRLAVALRRVAAAPFRAGLLLAAFLAGRAARLRVAVPPDPPSCDRRFFSFMSSTLNSESCLSMSVPDPDSADWEHSGQRARFPSYFIVSRVTALPHSEQDVT